MVSTLSGLNFNLYRERLGKTKVVSSASWHTTAKHALLVPILQEYGCPYIHSILSHWPLSPVTNGEVQLTHAFTTGVTSVHAHMLQTRWKGKLRLSLPHAPVNTNTKAGYFLMSVSFCMVPHKSYLSTALLVLQWLEVIHKMLLTQQQIPAMLLREETC